MNRPRQYGGGYQPFKPSLEIDAPHTRRPDPPKSGSGVVPPAGLTEVMAERDELQRVICKVNADLWHHLNNCRSDYALRGAREVLAYLEPYAHGPLAKKVQR